MDTNRPYDIYDFDVIDAQGNSMGRLTGFWVDTATQQPEFAAVKTGWLMGKNHVIPIRDAHVDYAKREIRVPYEERNVRTAPSFSPDHDLQPAEEDRIYSHFGLPRSTRASPTGLPGAGVNMGEERVRQPAEREVAEMTLHEERAHVDKRVVDEGQVRLRKVVRSEVQEIPVELRRERVEIERIPASEMREGVRGERGLGQRGVFEEDEVTMSETREEPVIRKDREVIGGVRATKEVSHERETVRADIRREDVEVDADDNRRI